MSIDDLCLTDPQFFGKGDPYRVWAQLRKEDPVHLTQSRFGREFWSVTRYADAKEVFRDAARFSAQRSGTGLPTSAEMLNPGVNEHTRMQRAGGMLPSSDPPRHTKFRANFAERFALPSVETMTGKIKPLVERIVDKMLDQREFELVRAIAELPNSVIFTLMGIPEEDWDMLFRFANMHTAPHDPDFAVGTALETRLQGSGGSMKYCRELALERRKNPGDDLISTIATATIDGELLPDETLGMMGHMFIIGGYDTTRGSIVEGLYQFMLRPEEMERVRADRTLLKTLPDECMRYTSPVAHMLRTATTDTEIGGKQIREGDLIAIWQASANRDETVFEQPDRFDSARSPNPHISLGFGPHFCLGAHLARLEMRLMFDEFLNRIGSIEQTADPARIEANQFWGWKRMPIRVAPL